MSKSIRARLELVTESDIKPIVAIDAERVSSKPNEFIKANLLGYYTIINTWLMLVQQWSRYGWIDLADHIKRKGLFETIRLCDLAATEKISNLDVTFSIARSLWHDVVDTPIYGVPHAEGKTYHHDKLSAFLLLMRYPKRFSPIKADKLQESAINAFIATQKRLSELQVTGLPRYIVSMIKEEASSILDWDKLVEEWDDIDVTDIIFTPGVGFDAGANLVSKLWQVAVERIEYFPVPFGIPLFRQELPVEEVERFGADNHEVHCVKLVGVPKNYKTARVIAPEATIRQAIARRMFILWDKYLPDEIRIHDQTRNQSLARLGSEDGSLATIDLSSASDSICWAHIQGFLPERVQEHLDRVLPTHFMVGEQRRRLRSAATMGNSVTFILESVIFLVVAKAAVRYYNALTGASDVTVSVYGDDIIVPSAAAATVIDWLNLLGFIVNEDKSFCDPAWKYRESCGEEYFEGTNVSSMYFPRFPLAGNLGGKFSNRGKRDEYRGVVVDTMTAMVDLQHKMFHTCVPAAKLLHELIVEAEPRMTTSTPDQSLSDCWSYESTPKVFYAPKVKIVERREEFTPTYTINGRKVKLRPVITEWREVVADKDDKWTRDAHLAPVSVPKRRLSQQDIWASTELRDANTLLFLYRYQRFLKYGPQYSDDLSRILGVSMPPLSLESAMDDGLTVEWRYIK